MKKQGFVLALVLFLVFVFFVFKIDSVQAYCNSSSVTYLDVQHAGSFKTCPITVNPGDSATIWIKYIDAGQDSNFKYDHRSLWKDGLRTACNMSQGVDDCTEKWDSFSVTFPTTPGTYTYVSKAYADNSLNDAACDLLEGSKQTCAVTVSAPTPADTTAPSVSANNASSSWFTSRTTTLSVSDGGSGVNQARYSWDSNPMDAGCTSGGTTFSNGAVLTVSEGSHRLYLCARDNAGNTNTWDSGVDQYRVDSTPPTVTVNEAPASWQNANATATTTCSDSGSGCTNPISWNWLTYDSSPPANCPSTFPGSYSGTGSGVIVTNHVWYCATAADNAGNRGFMSTPVEFKVDKTAPSSSITGPAAGSWQDNDFTVSASDSDVGDSGLSSCYYGVYNYYGGGAQGEWTVPLGTTRTCGSVPLITVGAAGNCHDSGTDRCAVYIYSRDTAENNSTIAFIMLSIDYLEPSVGGISPTSAIANQAVNLQASVDGTGSALIYCKLFVRGVDQGNMFISGGTASKSHTFTSAGTYQVYTLCEDSAGNYTSGINLNVTVGATQLPSADFYFDPTTFVSGQSTTVRGWLKTADGEGIGNKTIRLQCWDGSGWPEVASGVTEPSNPGFIGYTAFNWTPPAGWQGDISCRLYFAGDSSWLSSTSVQKQITITSPCTGRPSLSVDPTLVEKGNALTLSASGLSNCSGKTVYFAGADGGLGLGPLCPPFTGDCTGTEVAQCAVSAPGTGCQATHTPPDGWSESIFYTAQIDRNGDGSQDDGDHSTVATATINPCLKTETIPSSDISVTVPTATGAKQSPVRISHYGYDNDGSGLGYEFLSHIQALPGSASIEMDDKLPGQGDCDKDLSWDSSWLDPAGNQNFQVNENITSTLNDYQSGSHTLSYGYQLLTDTPTGKTAVFRFNDGDISASQCFGGNYCPIHFTTGDRYVTILGDYGQTLQATNWGYNYMIVECTSNAQCTPGSSSANSDANANTAKCNLGVTANFPQNTCIDSVAPTITIGEIKRTSPDLKVITNNWFKAGIYEVSISVADNPGGSGVDTEYRTVTIRSTGPDDVFNTADDRIYSPSLVTYNKFSVWVGSPESSVNDCVDQGEPGQCRISITVRDLAGTHKTVWVDLKVDYTPPSAQ